MAGGFTYNGDGRIYIVGRDGSRTTWARIVAANMLGRALRLGEEVHHRNGDWTDDRPENLEVLTRAEHAQRHPDEMSWRGSRWASRICAGCGCDHDERTAGCRRCYSRHYQRRAA
jgi:hypothetical protein